ncbi:MAG TPA: hypothetical protein VGR78_15855 [Verrucomicrobiae bacterium]|jgi:hypothetical protein|nr:hypothetical protein [Verrucomicrobiae bacterium]
MRFLAAFLALLSLALPTRASSATNSSALDILLVVGASGEKEYSQVFSEEVEDWVKACRAANKSFRVIDPNTAGTNQFREIKAALGAQSQGEQELWIALIGHGTFDGKEAKFNLSGPDLSAKQMAELLAPIQRPIILIDTSSSSAPFINELSHQNRIIVTATKSGWEQNYTRFGKYFAKSVTDPSADLDKDGQVSVLEAFLSASRQVEDFYKSERRLATEHALLDDNGDGKGTPASFFHGVRPAKKNDESVTADGFRAHQIQFIPNEAEAKLSPELRKRRNELEVSLEELRALKSQMTEDDYIKQIEPILLDLSKLYRDAGAFSTNP